MGAEVRVLVALGLLLLGGARSAWADDPADDRVLALVQAVEQGQRRTVQRLLAEGVSPDVEVTVPASRSPGLLSWAWSAVTGAGQAYRTTGIHAALVGVAAGHRGASAMVDLLLPHVDRFEVAPGERLPVLHELVLRGQDRAAVEAPGWIDRALARGADPDLVAQGHTPLGRLVDARDDDGVTLSRPRSALADALLSGGASPDQALCDAAGLGDRPLTLRLVDAGARVDRVCPDGRGTPLSRAVGAGFPGTTGVLLAAGADPHRPRPPQGSPGWTALLDVRPSRTDAVPRLADALVAHGVDLGWRAPSGRALLVDAPEHVAEGLQQRPAATPGEHGARIQAWAAHPEWWSLSVDPALARAWAPEDLDRVLRGLGRHGPRVVEDLGVRGLVEAVGPDGLGAEGVFPTSAVEGCPLDLSTTRRDAGRLGPVQVRSRDAARLVEHRAEGAVTWLRKGLGWRLALWSPPPPDCRPLDRTAVGQPVAALMLALGPPDGDRGDTMAWDLPGRPGLRWTVAVEAGLVSRTVVDARVP